MNDFIELIYKRRVPVSFVLALPIIIFADPSNTYVVALGMVVAFWGEVVRTWSSGIIHKNERIIIDGPYGYVRNPLYVGSFFLGLGCVIMSGVWWMIPFYVAFFAAIYYPVILREEKLLGDNFHEDWERYVANVPRIVPKLIPYGNTLAPFSLSVSMRKNKEYKAWLGFAAFIVYILIRSYYSV